MKRKTMFVSKQMILGLVIAGAVSLAGCGSQEEAGGLNVESIEGAESSDGQNGGQGGTEQDQASLDGAQDSAKDGSLGAATGAKDASSEAAGDDRNASSGSLYEDFKNGNAKALYRGSADYTSYLETEKALTKGESYSINDVVEAMKTFDEYQAYELSGDIAYSMIDCGSDGVEELLVEAPFGEFTLNMIVKEIDGELVICYDRDSWPRSYVQVNSDGTIEGSGSGGAAIAITDYSYVDANGDFHYYYGLEETLTVIGEYYVFDKENYTIINTEGIDQEHYGVRDYYFEPNYEDRTHYYEYFVIDDNYKDVTKDADYDDSNEFKQLFKANGVTTYTKAEMDKKLADRAKEIGYPAN